MQYTFIIKTGNQADAFVISNVLVITIAPNIFICNNFSDRIFILETYKKILIEGKEHMKLSVSDKL